MSNDTKTRARMVPEEILVCPLCGHEVREPNDGVISGQMFREFAKLKEQGVLAETIYVATRFVKTMNENNPMWFKDMLEENKTNLLEDIANELSRELKPVQQAIFELKGNPQRVGKIQEMAIAKRLSALKIGQDRFSNEKSTRMGEDIECVVKDNGITFGKVVIESKRVKRWSSAFIDEIKGYMEREDTEFGILATTQMPDDSIAYTQWEQGVLIVKLEYLEPAYIFVRELLRLKTMFEKEHQNKVRQMELKDQILEAIKNEVTSGRLDSLITEIDSETTAIDEIISRAEHSLSLMFKGIRKHTDSVRRATARIVQEHIQRIKTQLTSETERGK